MMSKTNKKAESEQEAPSTDFGSVLADARKTNNASVEEVSDFLKIPAQVITAIESNDIDELPSPTFTQGYIRAYARYLNISEEKVLGLYSQAVPHEQAASLKLRSKLPTETNSQSPLVKLITILLILAGIIAIGYGIFNYYQKKAVVMESQLESKQQRFTGNSLNSPASQSGKQQLKIKQNARLTDDGELIVLDKADAETVDKNDKSDVSEVPEAAMPATIGTEPVAAQAVAPAVIKNDVIEVFAENGAWLEVYDASELRLFYNMLGKGENKTLTGQAPFRMALGNAASTRILINDVELNINNFIRSNNTASFMVNIKDNKASVY